ncbi:MAG: rhomboid family protein [Verrucomicrobiales bacterium]|nr:rhomboid family protein [Verrucomicrobiales bacterium]
MAEPLSTTIDKTICLVHPHRAAAARCPQCRRFFCGECITEHDGRLTCAQCLRSEAEDAEGLGAKSRGGRLTWLPALLQLVAAIVVLWLVYYLLARFLMLIPASFHDGTVWE